MSESAELIGRDVELAELAALLAASPLVTLTGPGGVGKTTLVRELVARASQPGPLVFVDLAAVAEPDAVEPAIAAAMGHPRFASISASSVAAEVLIIVDNCEHVLDAAANAIAELHIVLPDATICATSRSPLGLREEIVLALQPLGIPARGHNDPSAPAVELFSAVAARAGGRIEAADLAHVCELCRRIDGVPLAIEITATRTRSMSAAEILERLGDRLDTVGQGGFRREPRQRSVRETVEWSYHLLEPDDRDLFDRLGVLAGVFSLTMAHGVAGDGRLDDTVDRLDRLVAASLVVAQRGIDGATWYRQLDAVRACAREHLERDGELDPAAERFVLHMVGEAQRLADHANAAWTSETIAAIAALLDNLLHALRWTIEHDETSDRAFEIMTVLWGHQTRTDEVLAVAQRAIARWPDPTTPRWADAAATVATCQWIIGRWDEADAMVERALPIADDARSAAVLLRRVRGQLLRSWGRNDQAAEWLGAAADEARRRGLTALVIDAELLRAAVFVASGDIDRTLEITRRVRQEPHDSPITEVMALSIESDALLFDDPEVAIELAERSRELAATTWYTAAIIGSGRTAALGYAHLGELHRAAVAVNEAIELIVQSGSHSQAGSVLEAAALIAHRAGRSEWVELAHAATAMPSAHLLRSTLEQLPEPPPATTPVPDLTSAVSLASNVMTAIGDSVDVTRPRDSTTDGETGAGLDTPVGNRWQRNGDHWEVVFDGRSIIVRDSKGMDDLARLLHAPGIEVAAIDLADASVTSSDTGEMIDGDARREYEQRIRDLQSELVEAEDVHDVGRVELLTAELDALVEHLTAAVGLGRRTRRSGATNDRARTAVTRRIRKAIAHLLDLHAPLGRHLDASIRTGTYCAYRPERETSWAVRRQTA